MPITVQGSPYTNNSLSSMMDSHSYDYPKGLDLRPGSKLHEKIRSQVYQCAKQSYSVMSRRFSSWNKIDESLTAYISTDDDEDTLQESDPRKPVSIVVPYSYATLETILTYLMAVQNQEPMFKFRGWSDEDTVGALLLELIIHQQCVRNKVGLNLHTMNRDALAYGFAAVAPTWEEKWGIETQKIANPKFSMFGFDFGQEELEQRVEVLQYEGNAMDNIDPYRYLPDPNYSIHEVQKGDFVGWIETTGLMDLLTKEKNSHGDIFNVKYVKALNSRRSALFGSDDSAREAGVGGSARFALSETVARPTDVIHMYMKIIPKEFGIKGGEFNPDGEYPEKWYFALAADNVVISARPIGFDHDMFPVATCAPDFDGRTITPISRLEIVYGLQHALNFMFNSHVANVRKAVNDMFVVDPFMVNMNDVKNPKPGKFIRLKRSGWGKGVQGVIEQLKVSDVTRGNVEDAARIMDIMERVSAATHNMMGVMRPGSERRSAAEFEGTQGGALNRLERIAMLIDMQAITDVAYMFASHTKQLMSQETYVNVVGDYRTKLVQQFGPLIKENRMKVDPSQLNIRYDVDPKGGTSPSGNSTRAWLDLFQMSLQSEALGTRLDLFELFKYIARSLGAKNLDNFEIKTMPNQQVEQQVRAGNLRPVNGSGQFNNQTDQLGGLA